METLRLNSSGPNVELLQSTLKKLGFYDGKIDGIFGNNTKNSVINFQKNFGLIQDGIVGYNTWNTLFPYINGYTNYTVKRGDTAYLLSRKFNSDIRLIQSANPNININNLAIGQRIIIPFGEIVVTNVSYTYELLRMNLTALQKVYPFIELGNIGRSVLGRQIPYVKIGNGRKEIFYNASFHANEWITTPILMKFIEDFSKAIVLNNNIFNYSATSLFNEVSLYIVPMVNPDGVDLVTGRLKTVDNAYKKAQEIANNFPAIPFPSGWKANIDGIDLNLQFPARLGKCKRNKICSRI